MLTRGPENDNIIWLSQMSDSNELRKPHRQEIKVKQDIKTKSTIRKYDNKDHET